MTVKTLKYREMKLTPELKELMIKAGEEVIDLLTKKYGFAPQIACAVLQGAIDTCPLEGELK